MKIMTICGKCYDFLKHSRLERGVFSALCSALGIGIMVFDEPGNCHIRATPGFRGSVGRLYHLRTLGIVSCRSFNLGAPLTRPQSLTVHEQFSKASLHHLGNPTAHIYLSTLRHSDSVGDSKSPRPAMPASSTHRPATRSGHTTSWKSRGTTVSASLHSAKS